MIRFLPLLVVCTMSGLGCASTQEIETSTPQARPDHSGGVEGATRQAPLSILMTHGETALPTDVSALQFRITEVRLRRRDGSWVRLPSDSAPVDFVEDVRTVRRTLIDTRVEAAQYDSIAVTFSDVFVRFGPNAGAPLTTSSEVPQRFALAFGPTAEQYTSVALHLEPEASLTRSSDCRWFFVPVLRTTLSVRPLPSNYTPAR